MASIPARQPASAEGREPLIRCLNGTSQADIPGVNDEQTLSFHLSTAAKYCLLLEFLLELSSNVMTVPFISIFEQALCQAHFQVHGQDGFAKPTLVDEVSCKIPSIQSELASLRGWKAFFETLSGKSPRALNSVSLYKTDLRQQCWWPFPLAT